VDVPVFPAERLASARNGANRRELTPECSSPS
jgi:hypothetical protein